MKNLNPIKQINCCPDSVLEDTRSCIQRWILCIACAIEGDKFDGLEGAKVPRHTKEIDTRNVKLLEDSLQKLPNPIKTLIEALGKIKLNITEEKCRNRTNYESQFISELESAVMYTSKSMEFLKSQNAEIKSMLPFDLELFRSELAQAIHYQGPLNLSYDQVHIIQEKLRDKSCALRLQIETNLKSATKKKPLWREAPEFQSVSNAEEAVKQTQDVMNRIRILNVGGPLQTYFEVPKLKMVQNTESEAKAEYLGPSDEPESNASKTLKECVNLRRRIQERCKSILSERQILFDDAVHACSLGLRHIQILCPEQKHTEIDGSLLAADRKIQQEIKFLLDVLTVDRIALDQALRCIRATCDNHEELVRRDMINSFVIKLTQWRKLLEETYRSIVD